MALDQWKGDVRNWYDEVTGANDHKYLDEDSERRGAAQTLSNNHDQESLAEREANANGPSSSQSDTPDQRATDQLKSKGKSRFRPRRSFLFGGGLLGVGGVFTLITTFGGVFQLITLKKNLFDEANRYVSAAHGRRVQNVLGHYVFSDADGRFAGFSNSKFQTSVKDINSEALIKNLGLRGYNLELKKEGTPSQGFVVLGPDGLVDVPSGRVAAFRQFYSMVSDIYDDQSLLTRARYAKSLYSRFRISRASALDLRVAEFGDAIEKKVVNGTITAKDNLVARMRKSLILDTDGTGTSIDSTVGEVSRDENGTPIDENGNPIDDPGEIDNIGAETANEDINKAISPEKINEVGDELTESLDAPDFSFSAGKATGSVVRGVKAAAGGFAMVPSLACQLRSYATAFAGLIVLHRVVNLMDASVLAFTLGDVAETGQIGSGEQFAMLMAFVAALSAVNPDTGRNAFSSFAYQNAIGNNRVSPHQNNLLSYGTSGGLGGMIGGSVDFARNFGLNRTSCAFATSIAGELAALTIGLTVNAALGAGGFFSGGVSWGALAANAGVGLAVSLALDAAVAYGSAILAPMVAGAEITGNEFGDQIASYMSAGIGSLLAFSGMGHGLRFLSNAQVAEWDNKLHEEKVIAQKKRPFFARIFSAEQNSFMTAAYTEMLGGYDSSNTIGSLVRFPRYLASRVLDNSMYAVASITGVESRRALADEPDAIAMNAFGVPQVGLSVTQAEAEADLNSPYHPSNALRDLVSGGHITADTLEPLSDDAKRNYEDCQTTSNSVLMLDADGEVKDHCSAGHSLVDDQLASVWGHDQTLSELVNNFNGDYGDNIIGGGTVRSGDPIDPNVNSDDIKCPSGSIQVDGASERNPTEEPVVLNGGQRINLCLVEGEFVVNSAWASDIQLLVREANTQGVTLEPFGPQSGFRDPEVQIALRRQNCGTSYEAIYEWPSSRCRPPTAIPGRSMHEKGFAIDFKLDTCAGRGASFNDCVNIGDDEVFNFLRSQEGLNLKPLSSEAWHWSVNGG